MLFTVCRTRAPKTPVGSKDVVQATSGANAAKKFAAASASRCPLMVWQVTFPPQLGGVSRETYVGTFEPGREATDGYRP